MVHFYSEKLLEARSTPKLGDHTISAVHEWLCNTFAAILHIGGRFSIRNL